MNLLDKSNKTQYPEWLSATVVSGGVALIDKDENWTSFDVIAKLRNVTRIRKAGHAGTLDPLATGLLMVFFHKATSEIQYYQDLRKSYFATIKLGATTASFDRETPEENIKGCPGISESDVKKALSSLTGSLEQVPPSYSAKKINGQRAYKLARQNMEVKMKPSQIEIYSYENVNLELPYLSFDVHCSKGTYIRSLARDIGNILGCGGYLYALRRTAIGSFKADDALKIKEIIDLNDLFHSSNNNTIKDIDESI